ncbi:hypothetical protein [Enterobacter cloacae]|uniref:hypothetical protein n=1 Tax=Enterobacter cloacae TaxID=550 RepID=UPI0024DF3EF2|nr:hypothetical protein [Enterobacter cloacae]ELC7773932.1 hypothetical protein [Enterobacter hormaechei]MDK2708839.1 hypothetical protein [Enterobacter cloacae]HAS1551250.1 hypothetical protein [Enterobacter hormaechei]
MHFEYFPNETTPKARIKNGKDTHSTTMIFNSVADVKKSLGARSPTTKFVMSWIAKTEIDADGVVCVFDNETANRFVVICTNEKVNYVIFKHKGALKVETQQQTEYATVSKSKTTKEEVRHISEKEALVDRLANMHRRFTEVVRTNVRFDLYKEEATDPAVRKVLVKQVQMMKELEELDVEMIDVIMNDKETTEVETKLARIEEFAEDIYPVEDDIEVETVIDEIPSEEELNEDLEAVETITKQELNHLKVNDTFKYAIIMQQVNTHKITIIEE